MQDKRKEIIRNENKYYAKIVVKICASMELDMTVVILWWNIVSMISRMEKIEETIGYYCPECGESISSEVYDEVINEWVRRFKND